MKTQEAVQLFVTNCELRGLAVSTVSNYKQHLSYLEEFLEEFPTKPEQIERVLASIKATQETIHAYFRTYRRACNFLKNRYDITNPMLGVQAPIVKPKVMPTLDVSDINLLSIFGGSQRDNTLIVLFLDTGIRASEACGLKRDDIKEGYIIVSGKVGQRTVPISDFVASMLMSLSPHKDGWVFHGYRGKLTRAGAYFIVKRALKKIGVKGNKLGPHRLRHTFGRQYLMLGGDLRSLQIIMGHSNIHTTVKYTALAMEDVMRKHKKYSPAQLMVIN